MALNEKDVQYVARLARLEIGPDECALYTAQLGKILGHAQELEAVDTSTVQPTLHVLPLRNVLRDDVVQPSLTRDEVLANAPDKSKGCFRVPKISE
jgi:aspartyl-tRNA(Asn)/glutamyl-tRNA(Gln) amidotransferase subunit C